MHRLIMEFETLDELRQAMAPGPVHVVEQPSSPLPEEPMSAQELIERLRASLPANMEVIVRQKDAEPEGPPNGTGKKATKKKTASKKKVAAKKDPEPAEPVDPADQHKEAVKLLGDLYASDNQELRDAVWALRDEFGANFGELDPVEHGANLLEKAKALETQFADKSPV